MNLANRIKVKHFFVDDGPNPERFIPLFHRWIQNDRLDDHLLLDVADYRHVAAGLSVLLVAHEADFAFDTAGARPGLSYIRKRAWPEAEDTLEKRISMCLRQALAVADAIASEEGFTRPDTATFEVGFLDRLAQPSSRAELDTVISATREATRRSYGQRIINIESQQVDGRHVFRLGVSLS